MSDLGLIRSVLGVPARVLEDVSLNDGRRETGVITHSDQGTEYPILGSDSPQIRQDGRFAAAGSDSDRAGRADRLWNRLINEFIKRREPKEGDHFQTFLIVGTNMPPDKRSLVGQGIQV